VAAVEDTLTEIATTQELAGADAPQVMRRHQDACDRRDAAIAKLREAEKIVRGATATEATARNEAETATHKVAEAVPTAAARLRDLRAMLDMPGVASAVLGADPAADPELMDQVRAALAVNRGPGSTHHLRRLDNDIRSELANMWQLDPGEEHPELLLYVLKHRDQTYSPTDAAAHAARLAESAHRALLASEAKALDEYVIGRLPTAIGTAWTKLRDWRRQVNAVMSTVAASSGVSVRVKIELRDDLSAHEHAVYELSCKVADADRTIQQRHDVGQALQALISSAGTDNLTEAVTAAVDIRDWVSITYYLTRPGKGTEERWTPRSGLSTGERRLVALAPMLAAIAAGYDAFGGSALRLAALDEIPTEVDRTGLDGLARYLAHLDLDIICTSHQWDGSPGAWDGIDAHDLEEGPDGSVVAFPMLIRGVEPLPGDPDFDFDDNGEAT
jgi:hypothetical protein